MMCSQKAEEGEAHSRQELEEREREGGRGRMCTLGKLPIGWLEKD